LLEHIKKSKLSQWKLIPKIGSSLKLLPKATRLEGYYDGKIVAERKDKGLRAGKVGARVYGSTAHIEDFDVDGKGIEPSSVEAKGKLTTTWGAIKMVVER